MLERIRGKNFKSYFSAVKLGIMQTLSANVVNKIIGMISAMIITRMLTTYDYGIWSYTLNVYSYFTLISGMGLMSGNIQFATENKGEGKAYSYYRYCLLVGILIDTIIVVLSILVFSNISFPIQGAKKYILYYQPMLLIEYAIAIVQGIFRSKNEIKEYALFLNINTISVAIGTCGGALFGVVGAITGRYISGFLTLSYAYIKTKGIIPKIKKAGKLIRKELAQLWKYSLMTGASSALNLMVFILDISVIAAMIHNAEEVAIYKVGTIIPNALEFIPSGVIVAILPTIIYHKNDSDWIKVNVKKTYFYLLIFNFVLTLSMIAFAPFIIRIISGERYLPSVPVFRVLMLGYFFSATFRGLSVNLLAAFRRVYYGLLVSVTACISDVLLNYLLILKKGMIGAAYATLLANIVSATMSVLYVIILLKNGRMNELVRE